MKGLSIEIWFRPTGKSLTMGGGLMGGASWWRTARLLKDGEPLTEWAEPAEDTPEGLGPWGMDDRELRAELAFLARGAGLNVGVDVIKRVWVAANEKNRRESLRAKAERRAKRKGLDADAVFRKLLKDRFGQPMPPWIGTSGHGKANRRFVLAA